MSSLSDSQLPRVAAVLVVTDGVDWLGSVLATVAAQRYSALDLVVVDNASADGSADLLSRRIPSDRLITLPRRVGFGRAIALALTHPAVDGAAHVLLLHDDLVLAPDAIERLVDALIADPAVGIVGPKLREWSDDYLLQEVGMTVDRFGRAETTLEAGELDQGQHDREREVLYVSTAGMLVRREVLASLGGLDVRFPVMRDDLDLCWRAWLTGSRVAVIPGAVGYHVAATSRWVRPVGRGHTWEPRYLAERHTLAAVLKNYGVGRLLWILPALLILAIAKTLAFVATRRFGDAGAVVRAYVWNVGQLPRTLRRRRAVQSRRALSDGELMPLFAPGLPRLRSYAEHLTDWLAGGTTTALLDEEELAADGPMGRSRAARGRPEHPVLRSMRDRPALWTALGLLLVYLFGLVNLLGSGQLVGGAIAPWPETARAFLRAYASPWNGEPVASEAFASPVQALLGLGSYLGFGSAWLAQRLLVLGLIPVAWVFALRAGRLVTSRAAPRVLGATLYVLSPPVLGALAQGRYGALIVATLLPALVLETARSSDTSVPAGSAWRAAALLGIGLAAAVAAAPQSGPLLAGGLVVVAAARAWRRVPGSRQALLRLTVAGGGALALLSPWLFDLFRGWSPAIPLSDHAGELSLWRALTGVPDVLPGLDGLLGIAAAVTAVAVVLAGLLLGLRARPGVVVGLVGLIAVCAVAAWAADRAHLPWLWSPGLLLPAALAQGGLGIVAARYFGAELRSRSFGGRQIVVVVAVLLVGLGIVTQVVHLGSGPWRGLTREPELVPAFVSADAERVGRYRVVLLQAGPDGVRWDVTGPSGPSMVEFGTLQSDGLLAYMDEAIAGAVGGADLSAGTKLGLLNVRYIVMANPDASLAERLGRQPALEPLPSGGGQVYRVRSWLPRAVVLSPDRAALLDSTGELGSTADIEENGLRPVAGGVYRGPTEVAGGTLVVSEAAAGVWRAWVDGMRLPAAPPPAALGEWPVNAFEVGDEVGTVTANAAGGVRHRLVITGQVVILLLLVSLALRPPRFTQRRAQRALGRRLPEELSGSGAHRAPAPGDSDDRAPEVTS